MQAKATALGMLLLCGAACTKGDDAPASWLTAPSRAEHEQYFPIGAGPHAVDCNQCHGVFETFSKFDCLECHKQPDVQPRHDGLAGYAYESASCYRCHPTGTAGGLEPAEHARFFPIDAASKHAATSCADCHLDAANRKMIDCTSCHRQAETTPTHASVGGFAWQATATGTSSLCLKCHADSQTHRVAAHASFGITPETKHFKASCLLCHPNTRLDKPFGEDFRRQDCTTCHSETKDRIATRHGGIPDFGADTASCRVCHPNGGPSGTLDHTRFFPIDPASKHASTSCSQCHVDSTNRKEVDCTSCHAQAEMTPKHASVGGFAWQATATGTSSLCLKCHADSQIHQVAAHAPFGITPDTKHFKSSCLLCHPNTRLDKPFGEDFKRQDCTACHAEARDLIETKHAGVAGFSRDTGSCLACHPNGGPAGDLDHAAFFPIDAASTHTNISCAQCHVDPGNRKAIDCTSCHAQAEMTPRHASVGGFAWQATATGTSSLCLKCHADSQIHQVAAHAPFGITPETKHFQASCLLCHPNTRLDKPFGEDFRRQDCTTCHAEARDRVASRHSGIPGFAPTTPSCLGCHPNGGPAPFEHSPFFPIDAASKHTGVSCAQCHPTPTNRRTAECTTCHTQAQMTPKHGNVGGFAWQGTTAATSALCVRCHADSQVDRLAAHLPFRILPSSTMDVKHVRESCLVCHASSRLDKPFGADFTRKSCAGCHAQGDMNDKHQGMPTYRYETAVCLTCHANGGKP